ncbi:helix-turn-helix domain-containing protein [Halostagnicola sp. A56]|uniref:helix-turn-helix domain-containing protein n=1 Tax=Halostagnicola sp. A56 TaxID=1495067 RepID=UPI0009E3C370
MTDHIDQGIVKSDQTLFTIIEALDHLGQAGVTDLANYTGKSKSSVHKHLKTLDKGHYVVKDRGQYRLSFKFLHFGGSVRSNCSICDKFSRVGVCTQSAVRAS